MSHPFNHDLSFQVYLLPVQMLEFKEAYLETSTVTPMTLALKMFTFLDGEDEPVMFTDCADVPYNVELSDNKNFELVEKIREYIL